MSQEEQNNHFGFRKVSHAEKEPLVAKVFQSVAQQYDLMNDVMSFGLHRLWKAFTIRKANLQPGNVVLDIASGTGDLVKAFAKEVGDTGKVIMSDINEAMLEVGYNKLIDAGFIKNILCVQANAEELPFASHTFDCISIAFGLRNVTHKNQALSAMYRALKPGKKVLILEFSKPSSALIEKMYDIYSFNVIPKMGEWLVKDRESYQYLVESIRMHPNQEELKYMMEQAGFEDVVYYNLCAGIVALHIGYKY